MNLIIEIDGPVLDIAPVWYRVHCDAAADVGWSALDQATFWRLTRKQGREADLLRGAKPAKLKDYLARFDESLEADEVASAQKPVEMIDGVLASLSTKGSICLVTLGWNIQVRRKLLERFNLLRFASRIEQLGADPRKRPGELRALSAGDKRTLVAAASDSVIRAAGEAGIITVGIPRGSCSADRLHRAGADVVFPDLDTLRDAIAEGSEDLTRAGLLPPAMG
jgi:phosphoglycolate phosphatase-like HAD superfamily hydrolase